MLSNIDISPPNMPIILNTTAANLTTTGPSF